MTVEKAEPKPTGYKRTIRERILTMDPDLMFRPTLLDAYDRSIPMLQMRFRNADELGWVLEQFATAGLGFTCTSDPDDSGYAEHTEENPLLPVLIIVDLDDPYRAVHHAPKGRIIT